MRQIAAILSTAFAVNTTRGGWKDICPPDTYQILNKCEKFESELFSDDDRAMMVGSINDVLIPISSMTGMISDNEIIETIGDKIIGHSHKFELHKKPISSEQYGGILRGKLNQALCRFGPMN